LPPKIVLNETFANNNVTEEDVFTQLRPEWCTAANADHQSKLDLLKASTKGSGCGRGCNFPHIRHVHQNDIVVSDYAGGVSVWVS
jgi:hypothetical protein